MKKILILVTMVLCMQLVKAQPGFVPYYSKVRYIGVAMDSLLYIPVKDTTHTPARLGAITIRPQDSLMYVSIATTAGVKRWDRLGNVIGAISISQLNDSLALYVRISDTATMLANYRHWLAGYVSQSRTLTINGTTYDLSANRSWSVGTVTQSQLDDTAAAIRADFPSGGGSGSTLFDLSGANTATGNVTGNLSSYVLNIINSRGYARFQDSATYPFFRISHTGADPIFQLDSAGAILFKVFPSGRIEVGDSLMNIFFGHNSGRLMPKAVVFSTTTNHWNIGLGENTLEFGVDINDMVAISPNTFRSVIKGFHSIGIGTGVGSNATYVEDVIGIGVDNYIGADTVTRSVALGSYNQYKTNKSSGNTSTGYASQYGGATGPWTGSFNTSDGEQSLRNITTAWLTTAGGSKSLFSYTTGGAWGGQTTAYGANSAYNYNEDFGLFLGYSAGYYATEARAFYLHTLEGNGIVDEATGKQYSMLYGLFGGNGANMLRMNGRYGINTTPDSTFHVVGNSWFNGKVRITDGTQSNGYVLTSDANGNASWQAASGGGGGSPAGNYGNIQLNRNGAFDTPGSDSLGYTTSGGFVVKNLSKIGGELWLNKTFQPYHATNDKQFRITNSGTGVEGLFISISDAPVAYIETTAGYNLVFNVNGNTNSLTFGSAGIGINRAAASGTAIAVRGIIKDDDANGNFHIQPYPGSGTRNPTYSFYDDYDAGLRWQNYDKISLYTNGTSRLFVNDDGRIGVGTDSPAASSLVDITSTTQGFLMPRMTGTQAEAISSPAEGLLIYSTDGSGSTITSKGWWGYDGSNWVKLN